MKGIITRKRRDDWRFTMEFEVEAGKVEKSIIGYGGEQIVLARLVVKRGETGERLVYPVLAVAELTLRHHSRLYSFFTWRTLASSSRYLG